MVMPSVQMVQGAIDAIEADGGDASLPTSILDQDGYTVAVVQRTPAGTIAVTVPDAPTRSVAGVVQSVTGFLDKVAGTLTNIATQLQKTGNAVQGAAGGAQAGWNAPTDWTPYVIGGLAIATIVALASSSSRGRR